LKEARYNGLWGVGVDALRKIPVRVGDGGNWDMRIHRFKMMLYSIQSSAFP
jgi:hypothetical protein